VGTDKLLVGAYLDDEGAVDAGAAYLFSTNGTLLTTFTNPSPELRDYFGFRLAALGTDKVILGCYQDGAATTGAAYLFSTNGSLLRTFRNPVPWSGDYFSSAVAPLEPDKILIGAFSHDGGTTSSGVVFLFDTNGAILTTFTNPTPARADSFGQSIVALGADKVLIGAPQDDAGEFDSGVAHLFTSGGALLHTFTNPTPGHSDYFGGSLAVLDQQLVLVGAYSDDTGAIEAGVAYLFHTSGTLLTTFTNPTPASYDHFGSVLAVAGPDRVLIGAPSDERLGGAEGTVYLFHTNGSCLAAFCAPPSEQSRGAFGASIATFGPERFAIGFHQDDIGADNAGSAHLFNLQEIPVPAIRVAKSTDYTLRLSWPREAAAFRLEETYGSDITVTPWKEVTTLYQTTPSEISVVIPSASGTKFYRLRYP
jgi:hypothetical protein